MTTFERTDDVVSPEGLAEVLGLGDQDELSEVQHPDGVIGTCQGEWRREPDGFFWRWWEAN